MTAAQPEPADCGTRGRLLRAARTVFERDRYVGARVTDIAKAAGVSHGSFYTYFSGKPDVLQACLTTLYGDLLAPWDELAGTAADPSATVRTAIRAFVDCYRRNAALLAALAEAAVVDEDIRRLPSLLRQGFVARTAQAIRTWQAAGAVGRDVDADVAAHALCGMVHRFAYVWLVLDEPFDGDAAVRTLTTLWCRGLGLTPSA